MNLSAGPGKDGDFGMEIKERNFSGWIDASLGRWSLKGGNLMEGETLHASCEANDFSGYAGDFGLLTELKSAAAKAAAPLGRYDQPRSPWYGEARTWRRGNFLMEVAAALGGKVE